MTEERRKHFEPGTTSGAWYVVRQVVRPRHERKYGRRDTDVPFWWLVMDRWGIHGLVYAIATALAFYIAKRWGGL